MIHLVLQISPKSICPSSFFGSMDETNTLMGLLPDFVIDDLKMQQQFMYVKTVLSSWQYHCSCNCHQITYQSSSQSTIQPYHCLCSFYQIGCVPQQTSHIYLHLRSELSFFYDNSWPKLKNFSYLKNFLFIGAGHLLSAISPFSCKRFLQMKKTSRT